MEPVTTDSKEEIPPLRDNTPALAHEIRSTEITEAYVTGFVDGEGSFLVSFNRRPMLVTGLEVRPSFSISQHERNLEILQKIQSFFGCGSIRFDRHDQTYKYEVRSLEDLWGKIIPHFKRTPLQTSKAKDFELFVEVCSLMREKRHRSSDGAEAILSIAYSMNNLGARRYAFPDLLQIVRKMKV